MGAFFNAYLLKTVRTCRLSAGCTVLLCLLLAIGSFSGLHAEEGVQASSDATLSLMEQQAETVDTLDTVIETQVQAGGMDRTLTIRLVMDRTVGKLKAQTLGPNGEVLSQILVDGANVFARGQQGDWLALPMDAPTRATLEGLGARFGKDAEGGLAGLERSDGAAIETAAQADTTPTAMADDLSPSAAGEDLPLLRRRHFSPHQLDQARQRIQRRLERRKKGLQITRVATLDKDGRRSLRLHSLGGPKARPWDDELVSVDVNSGLTLESSQFIRASRFPGGKKHVSKKARRLRDRVPGASEDTDADPLIELTRHQVLKTERRGGAELVTEAETVNQTMDGEMTVHTHWKASKVNVPIDAKEFQR